MDISFTITLARKAVNALMTFTKKGAEAFTVDFGISATDKVRELSRRIEEKIGNDREAMDVLRRFQENPYRYSAILQDILKEKFDHDRDFATKLDELLKNEEFDIFSVISQGYSENIVKPSGGIESIDVDGEIRGDEILVGNVSGDGIVVGKNIRIEEGTINISEQQLTKIPNEYAQSLRDFSHNVNQHIEGQQHSIEQVKEINNSIKELAKEVQNIEPKEENILDYINRIKIEAKTTALIDKVLTTLPETAERDVFTPLAPFSTLIGKGLDNVVTEIKKAKESFEPITGWVPRNISTMNLDKQYDHDLNRYERIQKYPYAIFPSKIALGDVRSLRVIIKAIKPEPIQTPTISQAAGKIEITSEYQKEVSILIIVDPDNPNFEIQGDYNKTAIVPVEQKDSNPVIFDLKAKKEGSANIKLEFFQQGNYLGQLVLLTNVVSTKLQADITSSQSVAQGFELMRNIIHDSSGVTLIIFQTESQPSGKYDIIFYSEGYGVIPAGSISLEHNPESKFHHIFEDIENTNLSLDEIEDRINDKGLNLYDEIIPNGLKELYWKIRDNIKSIQVYSKEPWIPWEIIKPWRKLDNGEPEEDEFFCERFIFSRWIMGTKIETKEKIRKVKVVVPSDSRLKSVLDERDWLIKFVGSRGLDASVDSSYEEVKSTLKTGGYDLIHFSSHGRHENGMPLYSVIELEDGRIIRPEDISGMSTKFGISHPLIFLNSCQSGAQGFSLTGVQGWVKKFLDSGASVFIGTLWSVSDETALKFTQELYNELSKEITIGEAVRIARKNCKKFGDPSWLAYELYGQPNMKIALTK